MSATVVVSILQGAAAVLAFSRTSEFLSDGLKSYVREEDGAVILRMVGGLGVAIFCLEWVALALAFVLRYYVYVDRECGGNPMRRSAKVGGEDGAGTWPWPFQIWIHTRTILKASWARLTRYEQIGHISRARLQ
uniref:Uncharacterized protein n=1 Tax=Zea mays TaxID=4577 RepID=Q5GAQ9_MAIZE|nr:unknown [Zea mays]